MVDFRAHIVAESMRIRFVAAVNYKDTKNINISLKSEWIVACQIAPSHGYTISESARGGAPDARNTNAMNIMKCETLNMALRHKLD